MTKPSLYDKLYQNNIPLHDRIDLLSAQIDQAGEDFSQDALHKGINAGKKFLTLVKTDIDIATVRYCIANAYGCLQRIPQVQPSDNNMPWENDDLEQELINLRIAYSLIKDKPISEVKSDLPFRIATNLGNALNYIGRFCDAIENWDYVIDHYPKFSMAHGNRAFGLKYCAGRLYDSGHQYDYLTAARTGFEQALKGKLESNDYKAFKELLSETKIILGDCYRAPLKDYSLGRSQKEKDYRNWVLSNRMFINPLNDLGKHSIAAQDILTLPSIITPIQVSQPEIYGLFNQMKQEYVSARFLLFEGINENRKKCHFSDRKVLLYNTLDYPVYGINIEKIKIAFLWSCSVLDKIAFLINHYFKLEIPEHKISFKTVWYKNPYKKELRTEFASSKNWPLRGLFWLSKDFYEDEQNFKESIEPDAKELWNIRNHLTHKYLKVHDDSLWLKEYRKVDFFDDKLSFSIKRGELISKAVKLCKIVRNGLIYVALAVHAEEETLKLKLFQDDRLIADMNLDVYDDNWKL